MFTAQLFPFQTKHEESLLAKCADHEELVLSAPTGAGKTVLVSKFIDDYLDENPNTVFLWLCPGAGGLEKQSQDSFREVTSGIPDGDVYAFINESDPRGKVFFINWDKINRASNVVLREGEHRDLMGKVLFCHTNGIDIFMLIASIRLPQMNISVIFSLFMSFAYPLLRSARETIQKSSLMTRLLLPD